MKLTMPIDVWRRAQASRGADPAHRYRKATPWRTWAESAANAWLEHGVFELPIVRLRQGEPVEIVWLNLDRGLHARLRDRAQGHRYNSSPHSVARFLLRIVVWRLEREAQVGQRLRNT